MIVTTQTGSILRDCEVQSEYVSGQGTVQEPTIPALDNAIVTWVEDYQKPSKFKDMALKDALSIIIEENYQADIEHLRSITDKDIYKEEKKKLPCISFNGSFSEKVINANFKASSQLFHFDIDALEGDIEDHKAKIAEIPSCVFVFVSPSGKGLKGALRVAPDAIQNDGDFKRLFPFVEGYFKSFGYTIDGACKDVRRFCYLSHDPALYINWHAEVFQYENINATVEKPVSSSGSVDWDALDLSDENRCIQRIARIFETAVPGNRHLARLKAGRLAGGFIEGGRVEDHKMQDILHQMSDLIADGGVTSPSELKTLWEAVAHGKQSPIIDLGADLDELGDLAKCASANAVFKTTSLPSTDARDGTFNTRALTERGNALRLMDTYAGQLHHVNEAKCWLHWQHGGWVWDNDVAMTQELAAQLSERIYQEGHLHMAQATLFARWARTSQAKRTIDAAVSILSRFDNIRLPLARIDADPYLVGFDNAKQVLDLRKGVARPARQGDYITKSLKVRQLGESSKAVRFHHFLDQVFNGDQDLIGWIKRWCGYLLTGKTSEQIFTFLYGDGSNGKSVFTETLRYILGDDYAQALSSETLAASKRSEGGAATPHLAKLIGARLAICSETENGVALAESLVKTLSGGDKMTVRKLYCSPVEFFPQAKLMMLGNHKPIIKGSDYGIWRRVRLIPFTRTFSEGECDPQLLDKLQAEAPHILAWMVEGCLEWQQKGLADTPSCIKEATSDYREEQDLVGNWIQDCCERSPRLVASTAELYESFNQWCLTNRMEPMASIAFARRLSKTDNLKATKVSNARGWKGIAVKAQCDVSK